MTTLRTARAIRTHALLVSAALACTAAAGAAQGTNMFRGNNAHSGVYAGTGPTTMPQVKWSFLARGRIISSPVIADQLVYVGSNNGMMYAIDKESGTEKWKFPTRSRVTSTPAVVNGMVYFGSYNSTFYALDAITGAEKWKFATEGERRFAARGIHGWRPKGEVIPDAFDVYLSSPAVENGIVYFGSGDSHVYALNATTGALVWKFKTGDVVHASPAIANGTVYIGSWDSYMYALDAATGRQKWRFKTGEDTVSFNQVGIQSSAAVVNGVVYFGCRDAHLYAVDEKTGTKIWEFDTQGAWVNASPAVHNGKVYTASADGRKFYEIDAATGKSNFELQTSWYYFASPSIAGNMAYIGNWDGRFHGIDLTTRKVAWTFQTDSSRVNMGNWIKPDSSMAFNVTEPGGFADDLPIALYRMFAMGSFLGSAVVENGVVYIGSTDGRLYALR